MSEVITSSISTVVTSVNSLSYDNLPESRVEYKLLCEQANGKKKFERQIVDPILDKLQISKKPTEPINFRVLNMESMIYLDYQMSDTFTVGRDIKNDIILEDEFAQISRIHFFAFFANNKIIIFDTWSLNGTSTINNSTSEKISSIPGNRKLISFDIESRFMIKVEKFIIIFNNKIKSATSKECIICLDNQRSIRFGCGHFCACEECTKIILNGTNECPICKKAISSFKPDESLFTFTV